MFIVFAILANNIASAFVGPICIGRCLDNSIHVWRSMSHNEFFYNYLYMVVGE
jgi:hypothetical protein